jgi:hypothetical protein
MKKLMFALLAIVIVMSMIPAAPVLADGNNPIVLEFCVEENRKGDLVAGIHFWLADGEQELLGKTVFVNIREQNNPNTTRFSNLVKLPGRELFQIPQDFGQDDEVNDDAWSFKTFELTDSVQHLDFMILNYGLTDSMTLIYEVPSIQEALVGIQYGDFGPCLGGWYK